MGKDRFSRFKRENYDNEFRYGNDVYRRSVKPKDRLSHEQKDWLLDIIKRGKLNKWELEFVQGLIHKNRRLSDKQNDVMIKIYDKTFN